MKLRRRLIVTMAVLLVIGILVADVVTFTSLRSFLYGRLDEQLDSSQSVAYRYLTFSHRVNRPATARGIDNRVSPDVYVMVLNRRGRVIIVRPSGSPYHPDPQPQVTRALRVQSSLSAHVFGSHQGVYRPQANTFNLSSAQGNLYRAEAVLVPQGTLITGISLGPTTGTLSLLVRIEVLSSIAIVVALCVLVAWIIRRGLRPLEDMATTAAAIASRGDLTKRVPVQDETSEVGRLGSVLNIMLGRIEAAFSEKSASELRLRQFVAAASHELRTPLTSIRGYAELLRKGGFSDEEGRRRALGRIEREATRMGGLVEDLLLLARLDQGRPFESVPVDLRRIGQDAVDDARAVETDRPIEVVAPAPVVVSGDRDRLGQVAHNLVRNALSHTPSGTPVRVEVTTVPGMGILRVIDEGPGLELGAAERVFDPFYRGDVARTGDGTGLGLTIVEGIAQAFGGRAWLNTAPGQGCTFTVAIPLAGAPVTPVTPGYPSMGVAPATRDLREEPQQGVRAADRGAADPSAEPLAGARSERIEDRSELDRGLGELGRRVRSRDDAGARADMGGGARHAERSDADHPVTVPSGVGPPDRAGPMAPRLPLERGEEG